MKKIFLAVVFAVFGLVLNAQPTGLVGKWICTTMDILNGDEVAMSISCDQAGMKMAFTFNADGTALGVVDVSGENNSENLTYKVEGNTIIMADTEGEEQSFSYTDGKLWIDMVEDGMKIRVNFKKE